jgi:predicted amidohydrolase YtcJ
MNQLCHEPSRAKIEYSRSHHLERACPDHGRGAVVGNTISAIGDQAEIAGLAASHTRVVDAAGGTVLPGLIEGHVHVFLGAAELDNLNLADVHGRDALATAVRRRSVAQPSPRFLFANQVSYSVLDDEVLPTREDLDEILPDRPFAMMCYDHHTVFANTMALREAGILKGAPVPKGSEIVMGADGLATGELREPGAFRYILKLTPTSGRDALGYTEAAEPNPPPSALERESDLAILERGQRYMATFGITSAHNMDGNFYQLELLQALDDRGRLRVRVQSPFHFKNTFGLGRLDDAEEMRQRFRTERVSSGRVKVFMDGVIGGGTDDLCGAGLGRFAYRLDASFTGVQKFKTSLAETRTAVRPEFCPSLQCDEQRCLASLSSGRCR